MVELPCFFLPKQSYSYAEDEEIEEDRDDHYNKGSIVLLSDTVVDPRTVVVELIDTSITNFAVPGGTFNIASTSVAVETVVDIL